MFQVVQLTAPGRPTRSYHGPPRSRPRKHRQTNVWPTGRRPGQHIILFAASHIPDSISQGLVCRGKAYHTWVVVRYTMDAGGYSRDILSTSSTVQRSEGEGCTQGLPSASGCYTHTQHRYTHHRHRDTETHQLLNTLLAAFESQSVDKISLSSIGISSFIITIQLFGMAMNPLHKSWNLVSVVSWWVTHWLWSCDERDGARAFPCDIPKWLYSG